MIALSVNARDFVPGKGLHPSRPKPKLDQTSSGKERENDPSKWLEEETKKNKAVVKWTGSINMLKEFIRIKFGSVNTWSYFKASPKKNSNLETEGEGLSNHLVSLYKDTEFSRENSI